jgi:hypothetical protein
MIYEQSRYYGQTQVRLAATDGTYQRAVLRTIDATTTEFFIYVWSAGDRPDSVANSQIGDPTMWWQIMDINPEILNPLNIPTGTPVRIPTSTSLGQATIVQ